MILVRSARMRQCTAAITRPEVGITASWPCQAGSAQRRCIVARTRTDRLLPPPRTRGIRLLEFRSDHVTARSGICQKFVKPFGSVATRCLDDAQGCLEIHLARVPGADSGEPARHRKLFLTNDARAAHGKLAKLRPQALLRAQLLLHDRYHFTFF